ncbi:MAG TPA: DUF4783 domain-containing protein [Chitinophagaceae bacterium]|jgi:hypothetical protein|nr:DUF4783 domain-containing protein [Chitinophagaceae bacterium]
MKTKFTTLAIALSFVLSAFAQPGTEIDKVVASLKTGNVTELSKYFDDYVQLTLPGESDSYSKAQAVQIVKDFFANNNVSSFELKHKGEAPSGHYCIGTLQTTNGNYRTNVFMKTKNNKEVIREIRFQLVE